MLNLDTHILIYALSGGLTPKEQTFLSERNWGVSPIVFWELSTLVQKKRIELDLNDPEVVRTLALLHVWPLSLTVCQKSTELDFSSDPADEIIAATSIVYNVPLLTRDKRIQKSKLVPFA
jgi:PIN domain nuclease of toxin-antitoxin system